MTRIEFDKLYYIRGGMGLGNWFSSRGWEILGTVRCIKGILFQATYNHYDHDGMLSFGKHTTWTPVDENYNTPENMRRFRNSL